MSAPAKPIPRDPALVYISVSSALSPNDITRAAAEKDAKINYIGPVGELQGEHIFQVVGKDGPLRRDSESWQESRAATISGLKELDAVQAVSVMEEKSRAKR